MPSYFYHLKFELYDSLSPKTKPLTEEQSHALSNGIWLPEPGADVFQTSAWPAHTVEKGRQSEPGLRKGSLGGTNIGGSTKRAKDEHTVKVTQASGTVVDCGSSLASSSIGQERNPKPATALEDFEPPPNPALIPFTHERAIKDWRFGAVRIESVDMDMDMDASGNTMTGEGSGAQAGKNERKSRGTMAKYEPLQGKNTETGWGIVHLYRDGEETPGLREVEVYNAKESAALTDPEAGGSASNEDVDYTTLCIPAVPSYLNPNSFLNFVGEQTWDQVSHFRMVMTEDKSRYLVLMKFRDPRVARRWRAEWDGKIFRELEPETCHVIFIKSITFQTPSTSFPHISHDPFTSTATASTILDPFPQPTSNLVELPTCPVCLERMDDTSGLLTTQCQHVFHCACLQKWQSKSCPVCRHSNVSQNPPLDPFGSGEEAMCTVCDTIEDLWICLICGHVGCGRYHGGHAKNHWKETAHNFALEIQTQQMWDYATSDGRGDWVHRDIRQKGDSKIEDMPRPARRDGEQEEDMVPLAKYENMQAEFKALMLDLLGQKDKHFEARLNEAVKEASKATATADAALTSAATANAAFNDLQASHARLQLEHAALEKDLARHKEKYEKCNTLAKEFGHKYQDEKTVSSGLLAKINHLKPRLEAKDAEIEALKKVVAEKDDCINDLLVNFSTAKKMEGMSEADREGATLVVPPPPKKGKGKGKGKAMGG